MWRGHYYHVEMSATCDLCGDQATVHEVSVHNGVGVERNLCERCAALAGLGLTLGMPPAGNVPQPDGPDSGADAGVGQGGPGGKDLATGDEGQADIHGLIKLFLEQNAKDPQANIELTHNLTITKGPGGTNISFGNSPVPVPGRSAQCGGCGLSYADFKQSGLLGCAHCYVYFEHLIGPLIERAQEGGVCHTGKAPSTPSHPQAQTGELAAEPESVLGPTSPGHSPPQTPPHGPSQSPVKDPAGVEDILRSRAVAELCTRLLHALKLEDYRAAARVRDDLKSLVSSSDIDAVLADPRKYAGNDARDMGDLNKGNQ
jgi:protein-arginine kinase activator protein McsA